MKKKLLAGLATGVFMLGMAGMANALVVFSDNFEGDTTGLNKANFINWTISGGTVDLIGTGTAWNWFPANGKYVDMDGSNWDAGKMLSSVALNLTAGSYLLQFDLAGNQRGYPEDTVEVQVNTGISSQSYSLVNSAPFQTFHSFFVLAAAQSISLSFEGLGGDNVGMLLDNIILERVDPDLKGGDPVPEPATMLLMGTGIAGLAGSRLRRRKK